MSNNISCTDAADKAKYTYAPAIEVCTIKSAQEKGILSKDTYYVSGYDDLKTYIGDASSNKKDICSQSADGADAYLYCSVEHGNIAYKRKGNKCVTYACPTGWDGVSKCTKPLKDAIVSKRSHCDERWYDWYTVPNYHLGNKYQPDEKIPGKCFNPCPSDHVPHYKNDPIDGATFGFGSKEMLDKCVPKNQYFGGKYHIGSDFCPLAWVYRVGATPDILNQEIEKQLQKVKEDAGGDALVNAEYQALANSVTRESTTKTLHSQTSSTVENVQAPSTPEMQQACRSLQTPERLQVAYEICEKVSNNEDEFLNNCMANGDTEDVATTKLKVLKQSCNATFCDANNDAAYVIKREPLCFKTETVEEGELSKTEEKPLEMVDGVKTVKNSIPFAVYVIMIACFIALIFVVYKYLRPFIRKVVVTILRIIFRVPKEIALIQDTADSLIAEKNLKIVQLRAQLEKLKG